MKKVRLLYVSVFVCVCVHRKASYESIPVFLSASHSFFSSLTDPLPLPLSLHFLFFVLLPWLDESKNTVTVSKILPRTKTLTSAHFELHQLQLVSPH